MNWTPISDDDDDDGDLDFNYTLNDSESIKEPCNHEESELNALCAEPALAKHLSLADNANEAPHTSSERTDALLEDQRDFQSNASLGRTVTNRISDNDPDIIHDRDKPILLGKKYFKIKSNDNESVNGSDLEEIESDNVEDDFSTLFENSDPDVSDQQKLQAEQAKLNAKFYRGLANTSSRQNDNEPIGSFSVKLQFKLD